MIIDLSEYRWEKFHSAPERAEKGWSYSSVYYFRDIKDIYLIIYENPVISSVPAIYDYCVRRGVLSENNRGWSLRRILEIINALRNFGFLCENSLAPKCGRVFGSGVNESLNTCDYAVFREVFFNYFRFKEFLDLYGQPDSHYNNTVFYYMENSRFVNRFILGDTSMAFYIDESHSDIMRFWDVFLKWGLTLEVLDKISGIEVQGDFFRSVSASFCIRPISSSFSVLDTIESLQLGNYIYIPDALRSIALFTHFSIQSLVHRIVQECENSTKYRMQSTSAIFIPPKEQSLFPVVDNTYMSHLLKL